tara:strand:- start:2100 stop:2372 length:273 start_codon:yes stop_codon:yes gene_type:complete
MGRQWRGLLKKDYVKGDGSLIKISDMIEGNARKEDENFEKFCIRRSAEKELLRDYLGGLVVPNEFNEVTGKIVPRINPTRQAKKARKLNR